MTTRWIPKQNKGLSSKKSSAYYSLDFRASFLQCRGVHQHVECPASDLKGCVCSHAVSVCSRTPPCSPHVCMVMRGARPFPIPCLSCPLLQAWKARWRYAQARPKPTSAWGKARELPGSCLRWLAHGQCPARSLSWP